MTQPKFKKKSSAALKTKEKEMNMTPYPLAEQQYTKKKTTRLPKKAAPTPNMEEARLVRKMYLTKRKKKLK